MSTTTRETSTGLPEMHVVASIGFGCLVSGAIGYYLGQKKGQKCTSPEVTKSPELTKSPEVKNQQKSNECEYVDPLTEKKYPLETNIWCADYEAEDGSPVPLLLTALPGITRDQIDTRVRTLWRYAAAFPLHCKTPISLGEGCTPLRKVEIDGNSVHFKLEWFNPTCSFKDRGTSVMLSLLKQQGVTEVLEDSSGNGGASVAAYAAAGDLKATIMAPDSTSPAKTVQMKAHGAAVELIPGSRQACAGAPYMKSRGAYAVQGAWFV